MRLFVAVPCSDAPLVRQQGFVPRLRRAVHASLTSQSAFDAFARSHHQWGVDNRVCIFSFELLHSEGTACTPHRGGMLVKCDFIASERLVELAFQPVPASLEPALQCTEVFLAVPHTLKSKIMDEGYVSKRRRTIPVSVSTEQATAAFTGSKCSVIRVDVRCAAVAGYVLRAHSNGLEIIPPDTLIAAPALTADLLTDGDPLGPEQYWTTSNELLVVGEADFSLSHCFKRAQRQSGRMTATSFKTEVLTAQIFPTSVVRMQHLRESGTTLQFSVDATKLATTFVGHRFDCVAFSMPFSDEAQKGKDCPLDPRHGALVEGFLRNCARILTEDGVVILILLARSHSSQFDNWHVGIHLRSVGMKVVETFDGINTFQGYKPCKSSGEHLEWNANTTARTYLLQRC